MPYIEAKFSTTLTAAESISASYAIDTLFGKTKVPHLGSREFGIGIIVYSDLLGLQETAANSTTERQSATNVENFFISF